ncbi:MAG: hypothetical protein ABI175_19350, partial [Polyangiales bacterium]
PWSAPAAAAPIAASAFRCTATNAGSFYGRLTSDEAAVVPLPEAPLRFAIAFVHQGKGETDGASVVLDRGDGLKIETLITPRLHEDVELFTLPGGVVGQIGDKTGSSVGWVTSTGKVVALKKSLLAGGIKGLDGDALLVADDEKLRRFGPQGLGPVVATIGSENDADHAFVRVGAELFRLLSTERRVELALLGKQGFEKLQEIVPWPGSETASLGLAGGAPGIWFLGDDVPDPTARVLLRFTGAGSALESRPLVSGEVKTLGEVSCDATHATWPRVVRPEATGKHHPLRIDGIFTEGPFWLATRAMVVGVGPNGDTCRDALIVSAPWENAEGYVRFDATMKGALVRSAGMQKIEVHGLTCKPSDDAPPDAFADWPGF